MIKHNHIAVWVIIIGHQLLGFLWYAPQLFLNPWLAGQGKTATQLNPKDPVPIVWAIVTTILNVYVLSWLVQKLGAKTFMEGAKIGMILFLGISLLDVAAHYKFLGIKDAVLFIDLGLIFVNTILTAGVLATWRKK